MSYVIIIDEPRFPLVIDTLFESLAAAEAYIAAWVAPGRPYRIVPIPSA